MNLSEHKVTAPAILCVFNFCYLLPSYIETESDFSFHLLQKKKKTPRCVVSTCFAFI